MSPIEFTPKGHEVFHPHRPLRWVLQKDGHYRLHSYESIPQEETNPMLLVLRNVMRSKGHEPKELLWHETPTDIVTIHPESHPLFKLIPVKGKFIRDDEPDAPPIETQYPHSKSQHQKVLDHWLPIYDKITTKGTKGALAAEKMKRKVRDIYLKYRRKNNQH